MTLQPKTLGLTDDDIRNVLPEHPEGPGCAIGIVRNGQLEHSFFHGHASVEHRSPIGPQTVFRIASVTKQFLCAGLLALADEGQLDLDAPLHTYLPEMHPAPGGATLRQAMSNTSGIRDHLELWYIAGGGLQVPHRLRDSLALAMRQSETNFPPGDRYLYSNANFLILSHIAEIIAGEPLEDYLDRRLFRPLGMTRTRLRSGHHDVIEGLATRYVVKDGGRLERGKMTAELWGEGSAHSCLEDLVRWLQYYRDDPEGLIARMREPVQFNNGNTGFYGLGLFVDPWRGTSRLGHSGLWPGYVAEIVWYNEADLALVCLSNCNAIEPALINKQLAASLIPGLAVPETATLDPAHWRAAKSETLWICADTLDVAEFSDDGEDQPQMAYYGGQIPLHPVSASRLALDNGRSEYRAADIREAASGQIELIRANGESVMLRPSSVLAEAGARKGSHAGLAGSWHAPDTGSTIAITFDGDEVTVETPGFRGHDWIATALPGGILKIEENTGPWPRCFFLRAMSEGVLTLSGPRVRQIRFLRN